MRQVGEEYAFGWRKDIEVDGHRATVMASHSRRQRVPRGHEMVRQMSRGHPVSMVDEVTYEWRLVGDGMRQAVIRQNPNGSFSVDWRHAGRAATVVEAARWWVEQRLAARRPPSPEPEDTPAPPTP